MKYKKFDQSLIIRFDRGEEIVEGLKILCEKEKITLGSFTGLGAADKIVLGLFNTKEKKYYSQTFEGDYELTSLVGNVTTMNGGIYLHIHANVADESLNVYGGHLNKAVISGTCEIILNVITGNVDRVFDEEVGLNVIKFVD